MNFEDVLDQEKNELIEAFLVFGEGKRLNKALADLEVNRPEFYKFYEAGQQSKQAEIDELQKRIDEAMKYVSESPLKDVSRRAMINFMDILKGNTSEH